MRNLIDFLSNNVWESRIKVKIFIGIFVEI